DCLSCAIFDNYAAARAICKRLCATVCQWCQCSLEGVCLCVCMCVCVCVCVCACACACVRVCEQSLCEWCHQSLHLSLYFRGHAGETADVPAEIYTVLIVMFFNTCFFRSGKFRGWVYRFYWCLEPSICLVGHCLLLNPAYVL